MKTGGDSTGFCNLEYGRLFLNRDTPVIYLQNGNYTGSFHMASNEMRLVNLTGNLRLNAMNVVLENQTPTTDDTGNKSVATAGWCNNKFGKVKTVNGVAPDSSGNVTITTGGVKTVDHISPDD